MGGGSRANKTKNNAKKKIFQGQKTFVCQNFFLGILEDNLEKISWAMAQLARIISQPPSKRNYPLHILIYQTLKSQEGIIS